jgi:hypothetical protein
MSDTRTERQRIGRKLDLDKVSAQMMTMKLHCVYLNRMQDARTGAISVKEAREKLNI